MAREPKRRRYVRPRFQRRSPPGAAPGTVKPHPESPAPVIRVLAYGPEGVVEREIEDPAEISGFLDEYLVTWINVDGLGDAETIKRLGKLFDLHGLALEDVVNVHQRAKVDPYEDHLYIVARMVHLNERLETEQISLFLGKNYVLTFQERPGDCLEPVRRRIRKNSGRIRTSGPDYLAYALIDAVIDSYFPVVDHYADELDTIDDEITLHRDPHATEHIHRLRSDLLLLRRCVRPYREALNQLIRDDHPLIGVETRVFLRDCYDHAFQLLDLLEVHHEVCSDLREFYLSLVSNRMNEIMKVLTIIATIFIPLSFITGLYGMNFDTSLPGNMPELQWPYGYEFALGIMLAVALGLLYYFRRKAWIGPRSRGRDRP